MDYSLLNVISLFIIYAGWHIFFPSLPSALLWLRSTEGIARHRKLPSFFFWVVPLEADGRLPSPPTASILPLWQICAVRRVGIPCRWAGCAWHHSDLHARWGPHTSSPGGSFVGFPGNHAGYQLCALHAPADRHYSVITLKYFDHTTPKPGMSLDLDRVDGLFFTLLP